MRDRCRRVDERMKWLLPRRRRRSGARWRLPLLLLPPCLSLPQTLMPSAGMAAATEVAAMPGTGMDTTGTDTGTVMAGAGVLRLLVVRSLVRRSPELPLLHTTTPTTTRIRTMAADTRITPTATATSCPAACRLG